MSRTHYLLAVALLCWSGDAPAQDPRPSVQQGMTIPQVRDVLGPPPTIARQVFYRGMIEQWIYQDRPIQRVEFLFQAGREPRVRAVYPPGGPR